MSWPWLWDLLTVLALLGIVALVVTIFRQSPRARALAIVLLAPAVAEAQQPAPIAQGFTAVAWCSLRRGPADEIASCDGGAAAPLYVRPVGEARQYHVAGVATVGGATLGLGAAWCRGRLCGGLGVVVPWSSGGIEPREWRPAVGLTWTPRGRR